VIYLWPDVLMLDTSGRRKSHTRSGLTKGATKPPDAASTWIVTSCAVPSETCEYGSFPIRDRTPETRESTHETLGLVPARRKARSAVGFVGESRGAERLTSSRAPH